MNDWREFWRRRRGGNVALLPLAAVFAFIAGGRRMLYQCGIMPIKQCAAPVVVVGNITAGGGGKTPVVIALAEALQQRGMNVGIVSRGYGGKVGGLRFVDVDDDWNEVGDEPLLIKRKTKMAVCVGKDRAAAAKMLADDGCDIIVSDDGLQHYRMARCAEVCVMRGDYLFGNGFYLPAGPLREGKSRADSCTLSAVVNVGGFDDDDNDNDGNNDDANTIALPAGAPDNAVPVLLKPDYCYHTQKPDVHLSPQWFHQQQIAAFAGTANPQEFFAMLKSCGIIAQQCIKLPDHKMMTRQRLDNIKADIVLTTEKDALKYPHHSRLYAVSVRAVLPPPMIDKIAAATAGI